MVIKATRAVKRSILETTLTIDSFGDDTISPHDEREALADYKIEIDFADLIFSRYIRKNSDGNLYVIDLGPEDDPADYEAEKITLSVGDDVIEVDENFEAKFALDMNQLYSKLEFMNYIDTVNDLAKAMVLTFESVVTDYISEQLAINKSNLDDFETVKMYPV